MGWNADVQITVSIGNRDRSDTFQTSTGRSNNGGFYGDCITFVQELTAGQDIAIWLAANKEMRNSSGAHNYLSVYLLKD